MPTILTRQDGAAAALSVNLNTTVGALETGILVAPETLLIPPLSLDTAILLSGFIGPLEQGWFTYRLYRLTKSPVLPLLCMCLTFARLVGIIGLSTIALHAYPIPEYNERAGWIIEAIVIISAAVDTTLATTLCYYLSSWRLDKSRVLHKIVNQIMIWTVEPGAATIFGALGLLVTYLTMKDNYVYVGFFVIIPKLFANSLLLSLNAREQFSNTMHSNALTLGQANLSMVAQLEMPSFSSPSASLGMNILGIQIPDRGIHADKERVALSGMELPTNVYGARGSSYSHGPDV
ncbi:hypothetical protein C8R46DRAFT_1219892 [Mycena filopes]|nr:hypothetical protein C8R46DRAFT_1219892 [Mycena filopes]